MLKMANAFVAIIGVSLALYPAYASVGADGSLTHSLPIVVPDGKRGLTPQIILTYNSNSANGVVGSGWSIKGVSSIMRVNAGSGIQYAGNDTYKSENGKLFDVSGNKTSYHFENENWSRIEPHGQCGDAACFWTVTDRNGSISYYGESSDSRLISKSHNGAVKAWYVNRVEDRAGQSMSIRYIQHEGQIYPSRVIYTGGPGIRKFRAVDFEYENRPDAEPRYEQGDSTLTFWRLKSIYVKSNLTDLWAIDFFTGDIVRRYDFAYVVSGESNRSLLSAVTEFGSDGVTSQPPISFEYSKETNLYRTGLMRARTSEHMFNAAGASIASFRTVSGDFNGDGRTDLATLQRADPATGNGFADWIAMEISIPSGFSSQNWFAATSRHIFNGGGSIEDYRVLTGDFNGDGKTDIATLRRSDGNPANGFTWGIAVELSKGNGFQSEFWPAGMPMHMRNGGGSISDFEIIVGDFNGDGKADIAAIGRGDPASGNAFAHGICMELSTGSGFQSQFWNAAIPAHLFYGGGSFRDFRILSGDFNGDGKMDIAAVARADRATGNGFAYWIAMEISTGSGFSSQVWAANTPQHMFYGGGAIDDFRILTGDFNGDGNTDIATLTRANRASGNGFASWIAMEISTGSGFSSQVWSAELPQHLFNGGSSMNDYQIVAGDFDGDGRTDIVAVGRADKNTGNGFGMGLYVEYSKGSSFVASSIISSLGYDVFRTSHGWYEYRLITGDFSGDGKADIMALRTGSMVANGSRAWIFGVVSPVIKPDLLSVIADGHGKAQEIGYAQTAQMNLASPLVLRCNPLICGYQLVSSQNVVRTLKTKANNILTNSVTYSYTDPRVYGWGVADRVFLGFEYIQSTDSLTNERILTKYEQDPRFALLPETMQTYRNGILLKQTQDTREQFQCDEAGCAASTDFNLKAPKLILTTRSKSTTSDGVGYTYEDTLYTHDNYGNVLTERRNKSAPSRPDLSVKTKVYQYFSSLSNPRIIGTLCAIREFAGTDDEAGILSSTRLFFDGSSSSCNAGGSGQMRVTRSERYIGNGQWAATTMEYDTWSNVVRQIAENGVVTETDYDQAYRLYPTMKRVKSPDGSKTITALLEPDSLTGVTRAITDHNNVRAAEVRDVFGRVAQSSLFDGSIEKKRSTTIYHEGPNLFDNYRTECAINTGNPGDMACVRSYTDALGREIRKISTSLADVNGTLNQSTYVAVVTQYNLQGQISRQSLPFSVASLDDVATAPARWTETWYDAIGRPNLIRRPFGASSRIVRFNYPTALAVGSAVWAASMLDEVGRLKTLFTDINGNVVRIEHGVGTTQASIIEYTYNLKGQLVSAAAPAGVVFIEYEAVTGLKKMIRDPVTGVTGYTYFSAPGQVNFGQVRTETRPAPQGSDLVTTTFEYNDSWGRLTKKLSGNDTTKYFYDGGELTYGNMRLTRTEHHEGGYSITKKLGYDIFGNPTAAVTDIAHETETLCADPTALPCHSVTTQAYDNFGRPKELSYADLKTTRIQYAGALAAVTAIQYDGNDYAAYSGYNALGQPGKITYRNGTQTGFTYDATTNQLQNLVTKDAQSREIQNLAYSFYSDGTIQGIEDNIVAEASYSYVYDALNRIKDVTRGDGKEFHYAFDARGNLRTKGNRELDYGAGTQVQTSVLHNASGDVTSTFSWSAAGNMLTRSGSGRTVQYTYNNQNKLTRSETIGGDKNGAEARSLYDDQGIRFLKIYSEPGKQTVRTWYTGGFELRETYTGAARSNFQLTRYIMGAAGEKVASITGAPGTLQIAATSTYQFKMASLANGKSVTGLISKSTHLFMGCYYSVQENRRPALLVALLISLALLLWITAHFNAAEGAVGAARRAIAMLTSVAFFSAISCSGSGGNSAGSFAVSVEEIDALYTGLPRGTVYYHSNHLGSSSVMTDESGLEKLRVHYLPYGEIDLTLSGRYDQETETLITAGAAGAPGVSTAFLFMGFTGQDYDPESDLYDYKARMYDPALGSFTTADSIVPDMYDPQAFNRYLYVLGNPVMYTDPSGHFSEDAVDLGKHPTIHFGEASGTTTVDSPSISTPDGDYMGSSVGVDTNVITLPSSQSVSMPTTPGEANVSFQNANYSSGGSPFGSTNGIGTGKFDMFALSGEGGRGDGSALAGRLGASMGKALIAMTAVLTIYFAAPLLAGAATAAPEVAAGSTALGGAGGQAIYRNLDRVTAHVRTFGSDLLNEVILQRLSEGMRTIADKRFYIHELFESRLMQRGLDYASAHARALERFGHKVYDLYAPEAVRVIDNLTGSQWMSPAYYKYWGL